MKSSGTPTQAELMWPTLQALERLGHSGSARELDDQVSVDIDLADADLDLLHGDGPQTEFANRCGWARTQPRVIGAVDKLGHGLWGMTELGRRIGSAEETRALVRCKRNESRKGLRQEQGKLHNDLEEPEEEAWKSALLGILQEMEPDKFERLCRLLLRKNGFERVEVTGRSGDRGIDGTGVLRVNLLSFHVIYQCKRYAGTVGPSSIRDFRGALVGRADKGLFITTGTFTKQAEQEAMRDGAHAIDLIDGSKLCDLLWDSGLGMVTRPFPDKAFFDTL